MSRDNKVWTSLSYHFSLSYKRSVHLLIYLVRKEFWFKFLILMFTLPNEFGHYVKILGLKERVFWKAVKKFVVDK